MGKKAIGRPESTTTGGQQAAEKRGIIIKEIRELLGLTQKDFAEIIDRYYRGTLGKNFRADQLSKMENAVEGRIIHDELFITLIQTIKRFDESIVDKDKLLLLHQYLEKIALPAVSICRKILYAGPSFERIYGHSFVGREEEIETVLDELSREYSEGHFLYGNPNICRLFGINGIGRTSVALEIAVRCQETSKRLSDPCFDAILVCLPNRNATIVDGYLSSIVDPVKEFVSKFGTNNIPEKTDELIENFYFLLKEKKTLLIIDTNCFENDLSAELFLLSIGQRTKVLIIDRNYWFKNKTELLIDSISFDDSIRLLNLLSTANNTYIKPGDKDLIAHYSCGVPLVIKTIFDKISKDELDINFINRFLTHEHCNILAYIYDEIYFNISDEAKILLGILNILPVPMSGECLCCGTNLLTNDEADNGLYELDCHGLLVEFQGNTTDIKQKKYAILPLLRYYLITKDFKYTKDRLTAEISAYIEHRLEKVVAYAEKYNDSDYLSEYIAANEDLFSYLHPVLSSSKTIKNFLDHFPNIKLPKRISVPLEDPSKKPYLLYDKENKIWRTITYHDHN